MNSGSNVMCAADLRARAHLERVGRARQDPLPVAHGQVAAGREPRALHPH